MSTNKLLEQGQIQKIGNKPVVVLPLKIWQIVEDRLEDLSVMESKKLRKKIAKARSEKKNYSGAEVKKLLGF